MPQVISETQKRLLHVAVDTSDAAFIARCVINIEEIVACLMQLLTLDDLLPRGGPPSLTDATTAGGEGEQAMTTDRILADAVSGTPYAVLADVVIKEEPTPVEVLTSPEEPTPGAESSRRVTRSARSTHDTAETGDTQQNDTTASKTFFDCDYCSYSSRRKQALKKHLRRWHRPVIAGFPADTPQAVDETSDTTSTNRRLGQSEIVHGIDSGGVAGQSDSEVEADPDLVCVECQYQAASTEQLHDHLILSHLRRRSPAPMPPKPAAKRKPRRSRPAQGSLHCTVTDCLYIADNRASLRRHVLAQHPSLCELLKCDHCDFTTVKRANYRQHVKIHLAPEDKPYKCEQCDDYSSANKEGLRIHINSTHKGVKPYLCDDCGQSFTGISMLSKHKLMKHKPKHLACPHCNYRTSLQTWLKDHMKKHSTDTPFICHFCSYAAKTAGRLKVHLRIHTGERPYKCHLCEYGAMEGAPLKKHLKNQHQLSVHRIDIREGKLFMKDGQVLETGLGTRTAPLPPGSFHGAAKGSKRTPLTLLDDEAKGVNPASVDQMQQTMEGQEAIIIFPASIIAQAASLSALPVQPESPTTEAMEEGEEPTNYTQAIGEGAEPTNYTQTMEEGAEPANYTQLMDQQYELPAVPVPVVTCVSSIISHSISIADSAEGAVQKVDGSASRQPH